MCPENCFACNSAEDWCHKSWPYGPFLLTGCRLWLLIMVPFKSGHSGLQKHQPAQPMHDTVPRDECRLKF